MHDRGGLSVFWDMYLKNRVGTPSAPADPATIQARANKLFDFAVAATGCATPWIAENELFGAGLTTPWSQTNTTYRQNVLVYLQTLAARGARPFLLVNSTPYTDGTAGDWWRQVAQVSDIVREVYFPAPSIWKQGPVLGSRFMRVAFRKGITDFTSIGIPPTRLGLMLGFQTQTGTGGREGLALDKWLQTTKWQALAARQAAEDLHFATVWSWGWGTFGTRGVDPDKPAAACVYLWTRSSTLCNGPELGGRRLRRLPHRGADPASERDRLLDRRLEDRRGRARAARPAHRRPRPRVHRVARTDRGAACGSGLHRADARGRADGDRDQIRRQRRRVPLRARRRPRDRGGGPPDPRRPAPARPDRGDAPEVVAERGRDRDVLPRLPGPARAPGRGRPGGAVARGQDEGLRALRAGPRRALRPALRRPLARCAR